MNWTKDFDISYGIQEGHHFAWMQIEGVKFRDIVMSVVIRHEVRWCKVWRADELVGKTFSEALFQNYRLSDKMKSETIGFYYVG